MKATELNPYCPVCRYQIDWDKEFNGGVRRNLQGNGVQNQINFNIPMNQGQVQMQGMQGQSYVINSNNLGNWNIHTIRNIFSVDPYYTRGNVNIFTTRFGNDSRFQQVRLTNPLFFGGGGTNVYRTNRNNVQVISLGSGNIFSGGFGRIN